ncbi:hypothetical protein [Vibrio sp. WXL103]|uniref:hypothetical protein n=1 Tax=Vibrio sp. WXL103 TaxID=3450710 RepID=UPI003EC4C383
MRKEMSVSILTAACLLTQVGCVSNGQGSFLGSAETFSEPLAISSETEEKIMKEATIAGTIGGVAVSAIIISVFGDNWPMPVKIAVGIGGTLAIQKIAQYMAMDQISTLNDVTLENDQKEALLTEARAVNAGLAKYNDELKSNIENNKDNKELLELELAKAEANKEQADQALSNRKSLLEMLVKDSEQYKEFEQEVEVLERENATLASTIDELNSLGIGAV